MRYLLLLIPVLFAVLHYLTGKYPFSALVTISCAVCCFFAQAGVSMWIVAAYLLSVIGDYFMAHSDGKNGDKMLLGGISGFFCAHVCFFVYSLFSSLLFQPGDAFPYIRTAVCLLLIVVYAAFLGKQLLPAVEERFLKIGAAVYACISLLVMTSSLLYAVPTLSAALFVSGIACIMISDTIIAYSRFLKVKKWNRLICPLYFACHILVAGSVFALPSP